MRHGSLFHYGMSLADYVREAKRIGLSIEDVRRTGEQRVFSPTLNERVTFNGRRKDAPRSAVRLAIRVLRDFGSTMT